MRAATAHTGGRDGAPAWSKHPRLLAGGHRASRTLALRKEVEPARERRPHPRRTMHSTDPETLPEKVLLAASQLESQGQSPFSAEALIVTAWQRYPRTF